MTKQLAEYTGDEVEAISRDWVEALVVGLNLCPFAAPVVRQNSLRYQVIEAQEPVAVEQVFLAELALIQEADEAGIATSLLILPRAVPDFYDYLSLVARCEQLLVKAGLEGVFQLASFHPRYLFAGVDAEDISHWTNRSPFPMLHIIRESHIDRALMQVRNPDDIPERNIALLRRLGREGLLERFPPLALYG